MKSVPWSDDHNYRTRMPPPHGSVLREERVSWFSTFRIFILLADNGFEDPREVGRAAAAWRYNLTKNEISLLELIATGLTNPQIAERTGAAEENTVKKRINLLFKKLGVHTRAEAATIPARFGFAPKLVPVPGLDE